MTNQENVKLSILIPVYNYVCVNLIECLHSQAEALGIVYEVIVADDGSTDRQKVEENTAINTISHCTYIIRETNVGRAAIRNYLVGRSRFDILLFLDCDIDLPDENFLRRYIEADIDTVVYGGVCTAGTSHLEKCNIRYIYEHISENNHMAQERLKRPYKSFRTTNFMIRHNIMEAYPFDERFRYYGYEDVLFGKGLAENGIGIKHIDNPVVISDFEPNDIFISKTEEGLRTLHAFRDELRDYSDMLEFIRSINRFIPLSLIRLWHKMFGRIERKNLEGDSPHLFVFNMYRLGYYLSIKGN